MISFDVSQIESHLKWNLSNIVHIHKYIKYMYKIQTKDMDRDDYMRVTSY